MSNNIVIHSSLQIPKTTKQPANKALSNSVETLGLAKIQQHLFICADQIVAICCLKEASVQSWEQYLKKQVQEIKLYQPQDNRNSCILKTKANCLLFLWLWTDNGSLPGWCLGASSNPGIN